MAAEVFLILDFVLMFGVVMVADIPLFETVQESLVVMVLEICLAEVTGMVLLDLNVSQKFLLAVPLLTARMVFHLKIYRE